MATYHRLVGDGKGTACGRSAEVLAGRSAVYLRNFAERNPGTVPCRRCWPDERAQTEETQVAHPTVDLARRLLALAGEGGAEEDLPKLSRGRICAVACALVRAELAVSSYADGSLRAPGRASCVLDSAVVLSWRIAEGKGEDIKPRTLEDIRAAVQRWEGETEPPAV